MQPFPHPKNIFRIKIAFSGQNWTGSSIWKCLTLSWRRPLSYRNQTVDLLCKSMDWFLYDNGLHHERVKKLGLTKMINFSNESVKIPTIYDLLFTVAICSHQNFNKYSSKMKNKHQNSLFATSTVFPSLEPIFYAGQKLWLIGKSFKNVSKAQRNTSFFRR